MKHSFFLLAVLVAVILFCPSFAKEQAVELTPDCSFSADADAEHITRLVDGRTGQEVAAEAFKKHISQQKTHDHIYMGGSYDSQRYGLYYSTVGLDVAKNDLFEHVSER